MHTADIAIIGAGPIGLELAVALKDAGLDYVQFDAGQIGQTITWYPKQVQFFSSPERIAICGVPLVTQAQAKATREEYLAYLRGIVEQFDLPIQTYSRVTSIKRDDEGFTLTLQSSRGEEQWRANRVVLTIGDMHRPRLLEVPGEDLPHVTHYFDDPHAYFRRKVLIVGGRNSAAEAAIRCHRAGAQVTLCCRREDFDRRSVKYWIAPELDWLIKTRRIAFYPSMRVARIMPAQTALCQMFDTQAADRSDEQIIEADHVLLLTGYEMDTSLLEQAGAAIDGLNRAPRLDHGTMQTTVPGLYVAGTAAAGTQVRFRLFIENCHSHVIRLLRALTGQPDAKPGHINGLAWERLREDPTGQGGEVAPAGPGQGSAETVAGLEQ
ncbi:MAG: NAD(P)-binding domain-containing protein [Phycisphaeraceae bacterium]